MPFGSHLAMSLGFFGGILPAVILVFYTLFQYEGYFKDKHFFFLLVIGLIAGTFTALLYYWSAVYIISSGTILSFILILVCFAIFEMLLFAIILSMGRFGSKFDLTYYGVVLGGTLAGVICMFNIYAFFTAYDPSWQAVLSIGLMIPTLPLFYLSLSSIIGFGLFKHKFIKYATRVVIYKTIFNSIFLQWYLGFFFLPPEHGWEWMVICFVFAIIMYRYSIKDILPTALPEKLKKHRRRKRRQDIQKH